MLNAIMIRPCNHRRMCGTTDLCCARRQGLAPVAPTYTTTVKYYSDGNSFIQWATMPKSREENKKLLQAAACDCSPSKQFAWSINAGPSLWATWIHLMEVDIDLFSSPSLLLPLDCAVRMQLKNRSKILDTCKSSCQVHLFIWVFIFGALTHPHLSLTFSHSRPRIFLVSPSYSRA